MHEIVQTLGAFVQEIAVANRAELEEASVGLEHGAQYEVLGCAWAERALDVVVPRSPLDSVIVQVTFADEFVRCNARIEAIARRARRVVRKLTQPQLSAERTPKFCSLVLSDFGPVWIVPRESSEGRLAVIRTKGFVSTAQEALWTEDLLGVVSDRDQIADEYDDLIYMMVSGREGGMAQIELVERLCETIKARYFDQANDADLIPIARKLVAGLFA